MVEYGLTMEGFIPKPLQVIRDDISGEIKSRFGANTKTAPESVNGQFIDIMSERLSDLWELGERIWAGRGPSGAVGVGLDDILELAAKQRNEATHSTVPIALTGAPFTAIPAGRVIRDPETGIRWLTTALITLDGAGAGTGTAEAEEAGAVLGLAGTITEIVSSVSGWVSVTNPSDAAPGHAVDSDSKARSDFALSFRTGGGSAAEAVRAFLLRLDGVTEVLVIQNRDILPDSEGRPGKSFEAVVRGGDDQDIGDSIWLNGPGGIESYGSIAVPVIDSRGDPQTAYFSRPTLRPIWLEVRYAADGTFPSNGEALILAEILNHGTTYQIGDDVFPIRIIQDIETGGLITLELRAGFSASPPFSAPLTVGRAELATFDSTRIAFVRTN